MLLAGASAPALAQSVGAVTGTVRETGAEGVGIAGALVSVDGGRQAVVTDQRGVFRLREIPAGWHAIKAAAIGHRPLVRDSVLVRAGQTTALDFTLRPDPVGLAPLEVVAERVDSVLDPLAVQDQQRFTAEDLRRLPVSSVEEAIALSSGAVGESYRGGRLGQQAFILDGLGLKNQLDASTGALGVRVPPDALAEASLVTNGFSARYGQAVSALVNLATRDGGDRWRGRMAYETDRPLGEGGDYGLDRAVISADGPLPGNIRFLGVVDVSGKLDAEPVNAPPASNPLDPRHDHPSLLPHNSGETGDAAAKLTIPLGSHHIFRLFGIHSADQRLLFDPIYKYDQQFAPVRRVVGNLLNAHLQSTIGTGLIADLRVGYFGREFIRGTPTESPDYAFGAFTGKSIGILGENLARRQDTVTANQPIAGFNQPEFSTNTPWGVPAYFRTGAGRGDLAWNRFRELRTRLDLSIVGGANTDIYVGGEYSTQQVRTFQRTFGYLPTGGDVPATSASAFAPWAGSLYSEAQARSNELALTVGMRYDQFSGRNDLPGKKNSSTQRGLSPRIAVSTTFRGATFVASFGKFRQAPDYQYLVDAAFDDTTRTGRTRQGNPDLGFEESTQYEFSIRLRPTTSTSVRGNLYVRRLDGLVASVPLGVNPDSSIFGNADAGSVKGFEVVFEREFRGGFGARVSYNLQDATATSSDAFFVRRAGSIDPNTGQIVFPAKVEFPLDFDRRHSFTAILTGTVPQTFGPSVAGSRVLGGIEGTVILRVASGLPFSKYIGDSLVGLPNDGRLPATNTVDLLVRRPFQLKGMEGSVYLDMRNVLNRRNIIAVRRDTGTPVLDEAQLQQLAQASYNANPNPIPYESPRYRASADRDQNGYVEGPELQAMYLAATRDFVQPIFFYGAPRLVRLGVEVGF
jgi:hypothetical protein